MRKKSCRSVHSYNLRRPLQRAPTCAWAVCQGACAAHMQVSYHQHHSALCWPHLSQISPPVLPARVYRGSRFYAAQFICIRHFAITSIDNTNMRFRSHVLTYGVQPVQLKMQTVAPKPRPCVAERHVALESCILRGCLRKT